LAAAAVVVAMVAIQTQSGPRMVFPQQPVLRGSAGGPIFYPRGHVLAPSDELKKLFPALGGRVEWMIEPQQDATAYDLVVEGNDGSAFAKSHVVDRVNSSEPSGLLTRSLDEGNYTLRASFVVQGLPQRLTAREFDVRNDPAVEKQLISLRNQSEPERTLAALTILQSNEYWNDARTLARTLPPSPERDRFLSQPPGR
jgi:hypothetical protein